MTPGPIRHDVHLSPLGRWETWFAPPPPALAYAVEKFWAVTGHASYSVERILPRGALELMFTFAPPHRLLDPDDPARVTVHRDAWVSGLQDRYLLVESESVALVAATLRPLAAARLFRVNAAALTGVVTPLDGLLPGARALRQRLLEAPDAERRFDVLAGFLARRLADAAPPAWIAHAESRLRRAAGGGRLRDLSRDLGVSEGHLTRRFRSEVGMTPKRYARLLRFEHLVARLERTTEARWADLAVDAGFADQPHLVHEFQSFAGASPREFLKRLAPDGQSLIER